MNKSSLTAFSMSNLLLFAGLYVIFPGFNNCVLSSPLLKVNESKFSHEIGEEITIHSLDASEPSKFPPATPEIPRNPEVMGTWFSQPGITLIQGKDYSVDRGERMRYISGDPGGEDAEEGVDNAVETSINIDELPPSVEPSTMAMPMTSPTSTMLPEVVPTTQDLRTTPPVQEETQLTDEEAAYVAMKMEEEKEKQLGLLPVRQRLQKLDFYFNFLKIMSEDCRQRMLCEVSRDPHKFYPLSNVLDDAVSFTETYQYMTSDLISTTEGARLLSYMEASFKGQDRSRSCSIFQYRCLSRTEDMINFRALCLWKEMLRWLTIHVIATSP